VFDLTVGAAPAAGSPGDPAGSGGRVPHGDPVCFDWQFEVWRVLALKGVVVTPVNLVLRAQRAVPVHSMLNRASPSWPAAPGANAASNSPANHRRAVRRPARLNAGTGKRCAWSSRLAGAQQDGHGRNDLIADRRPQFAAKSPADRR
jgi:hypothetical protein